MRFFAERPYIISLLLIGLVVAWMMTPQMESSGDVGSAGAAPTELQTVQVERLESEKKGLDLVFTGRTEPSQAVTVAAEIDGVMRTRNKIRGTAVKKGDTIAKMDTGAVQGALNGARAEVKTSQLDYDSLATLVAQGIAPRNNLAAADAKLQAAKARVNQYRTEMRKGTVRAPISGMLADYRAEAGDFLSSGQPLATIIQLDPIRAIGDVAERDLAGLAVGNEAKVIGLDGQELIGKVSYISPGADQNTRTFRVEVTVPNPDRKLLGGMTAQVEVPQGITDAYKISPALLNLSSDGVIQVATVNEQDRVELHEIKMLSTDSDGIWVTGIPKDSLVITFGQGFVHEGNLVNPVEKSSTDADVGAEQ